MFSLVVVVWCLHIPLGWPNGHQPHRPDSKGQVISVDCSVLRWSFRGITRTTVDDEWNKSKFWVRVEIPWRKYYYWTETFLKFDSAYKSTSFKDTCSVSVVWSVKFDLFLYCKHLNEEFLLGRPVWLQTKLRVNYFMHKSGGEANIKNSLSCWSQDFNNVLVKAKDMPMAKTAAVSTNNVEPFSRT